MSKRTSPGSKKRKLTAEKRTAISRKDAAAKRHALTKRVMEVTSRPSAQPEEKSGKPPAKFQTTAIPVKKTAVKRASPAIKTTVKQAAQKSRSFEIFNKSGEAEEKQAPQRTQEVAASSQDPADPPLRKESRKISLKAPGAEAPPTATESIAPAPGSIQEIPAAPEEEAYQPKPKKSVRVRKETIRASPKTPAAEKIDPMENWDILKPGKLAEVAKEDPDHKYAPPGLHETPAANLHQASAPEPALEPAPEPALEPAPEPALEPDFGEAPLSLDQALPLREERLRISEKKPFAGMAAARAAAAREPILSTKAAAPEPEPAPRVVLEQSTAAVTVSAQPPPAQPRAPEQLQSQLNTPLPPQLIQPKKDLGSILMTCLCVILGIIAAVMIYLAFFT